MLLGEEPWPVDGSRRTRSLGIVGATPMLLRVLFNETLSPETSQLALRCLLAMAAIHPDEHARTLTKTTMSKMALVLLSGSNRVKHGVLQLLEALSNTGTGARKMIQRHRALADAVVAVAAAASVGASSSEQGEPSGLAKRAAVVATACGLAG